MGADSTSETSNTGATCKEVPFPSYVVFSGFLQNVLPQVGVHDAAGMKIFGHGRERWQVYTLRSGFNSEHSRVLLVSVPVFQDIFADAWLAHTL